MKPFFSFIKFIIVVGLGFVFWPSPLLAGDVKIRIAWEYQKLPVQMRIYEVARGQKPRMWETRTVKSLQAVPVGSEISGASVTVPRGGKKKFILVAENKMKTPIYFFAAPHGVEPVDNALGFKFKCLCINYAYAIGPGEVWYRVVLLKVSPNFYGESLTLTHNLVGIDPKRFSRFSLQKKRRAGF